jgi:hypothetical protein
MLEKIKNKMHKREVLMSINKKANELLDKEDYSVFNHEELCIMADIAATESTIIMREARQLVKDLEKELELYKEMIECKGDKENAD